MTVSPTGAAMVAGVTGWPVKHSLSPRLHGYWLRKYGTDGIYAPFPIAPEYFEKAVRGLGDAGVRGLNVTVPHKLAAFRLADRLDLAAQRIGAVNTLVFQADGSIEGRNTDAPGFLQNLLQAGVDPTVGPVLVIGAGGATRGVLHALLEAGAPEIRLVNRTPEKAEQLVAEFADRRLGMAGFFDLSQRLGDVRLAINATSLGMGGNGVPAVDLSALPSNAIVHDIVYTPLETPFLAAARARGLTTVDGLGMLLHQAAPAFEAFYGVRPDVDDGLRNHLLEVL
ncbi:MAG: shikimate dehydrogenase [Minwuia sp.]|uniref:shikimate dehydrogenase n=1 Tax=Minwuia sp. TaxID=2493630 RepID=UPI003A8BE3B4